MDDLTAPTTDRPKHHELEQVVMALSEGIILIEPDQRLAFANKAALAMHGVSDIFELGATVDEYRDNFVLRYRNSHLVKPEAYPIDRVMTGEVFDQVIVEVEARHDPEQRWVHRIRSLVINDAAAKPDSLVLVIADVSDQFEAEDRFERTFAANPAPAVICRLADQRFVKVNAGFLEMTGFERDRLLGQSLRDVDLLEGAEQRDLALSRLAAGESIPQMEAHLSIAGGLDRLVVVAGQPLEVDDQACMLFSFVDLDLRRKAQVALQESEQRLATLFRLAPVPMAVARREGHLLLDVNNAFCATTGYTSEDVVGQEVTALGLWRDPEARERFERAVGASTSIQSLETRLRCKDGEEIDALVSGEAVQVGGEGCMLLAFQDISVRKRSEAEMMRAIEAVMSDATWFSQAVVEKLAGLRVQPQHGKVLDARLGAAELSARERDVLGRLCRGEDDPTIAEQLGLSRHTVRNHVASLFRKIGVNRRSAAVVWARDRGFGEVMAPGGQLLERQKASD